MKKTIRVVKDGIMQVTCPDERWYVKEAEDPKTGLPIYEYVPSVTWITSFYPKGIGFYKWLANHGWDEAEAIKEEAADKGSRVHLACVALIDGETVKINDTLPDLETGTEKELTLEEYECIVSFADWFKAVNPTVVMKETVVWGNGYAGTLDLVCLIDGKKYLVDLKTSQNIWPSHEIQVSAYKPCAAGIERLAILQLGYKRNKDKFKFTEIEDKFELFLAAKKIWENETKGVYPMQKDYPLQVSLKQEE